MILAADSDVKYLIFSLLNFLLVSPLTAVHVASHTMNYVFVDKNWHESSTVVARCKEVYKGSPYFSLLIVTALEVYKMVCKILR